MSMPPIRICLLSFVAVFFSLKLVSAAETSKAPVVAPIPEDLRKQFRLDKVYKKHVSLSGFPIVASGKVSDEALQEAAHLIGKMLEKRPDILKMLAKNKVRFTVMAVTEMTTDVPEHSDLTPKNYWDRRARGLGATRSRPSVSCGEENLLNLRGDPYSTENILIHEFGHAIHQMGLNSLDKNFDRKLRQTYTRAKEKGLWKGKYAATNHSEYWAEGVQSYFGTNRENDNDHNHVNTRKELKEYDPDLYQMIDEAFLQNPYQYQRFDARFPERAKELREKMPRFRFRAP